MEIQACELTFDLPDYVRANMVEKPQGQTLDDTSYVMEFDRSAGLLTITHKTPKQPAREWIVVVRRGVRWMAPKHSP